MRSKRFSRERKIKKNKLMYFEGNSIMIESCENQAHFANKAFSTTWWRLNEKK